MEIKEYISTLNSLISGVASESPEYLSESINGIRISLDNPTSGIGSLVSMVTPSFLINRDIYIKEVLA